ncbi:MAG: PH domain-containing protein [bacterium]|nr:PH domain-containing protein [bacterium]
MHLPQRLALRDGEVVRATIRRSKLVPAPTALIGGSLIVLAFFLIVPLLSSRPFGLIGFVLLLATGVVLFIRAWWFWYRTVLMVTDLRVIDLDQVGVFHRVIAEARFDRIDDLALEIKGIIATIFRLGTIQIQTAGASALIELRNLPHPEHVHEMLSALQHDAQHRATVPPPGVAVLDLSAYTTIELVRLRERIDLALRAREGGDV